jgi:aspartate kinase
MLYGCYALAEEGKSFDQELAAIEARYQEIIDGLELKVSLSDDFKTIAENFKAKAGKDYAASRGEFLNSKLLAAYLGFEFVDAAEIICFKQSGEFNAEKTNELVAERLENVEYAVIPGFYGNTPDGKAKTFSRGGSDITGAILAAALHATVYENWTDVDNVYAVNPNLVQNPFPVTEITYDEMRELAYAGFSVLHEEALYPAFVRGIPVNIRNTNHPDAKGTMIVSKRTHYDSLVTGIAGEKGFCALNMSKYLMNREVGFLVKVLSIIADEGLSIEHMPSGIDSVSIILRAADFTPEKERRIVQRISLELNVDNISVNRDLAIVMIVGEAMANTVGTTARAATALSKAGINLELINQGASEISVMFGVREEYCSYAVRTLYKEFFS